MMPSQARRTYSDFEAANRPYVARLASFLTTVSRERETHARMLNTLSMLEHMGARRIMVTQSSAALGQETLKHMAEEARHAFFFKRQADRFAGRALEYADADMTAPAYARMYFKRLESFIANDIKGEADPSLAAYIYMSMVIEFRAVWAYTIYQSVLEGCGVSLSLKSLLAEEQGHLAEMEAGLAALGAGTPARTNRFLDRETALFARLLGALEAAAPEKVAAA